MVYHRILNTTSFYPFSKHGWSWVSQKFYMTQRERRLRKQRGEGPGSGREQLCPIHLGGNHFLRSREGYHREQLPAPPEHLWTCPPPSSRVPKGY